MSAATKAPTATANETAVSLPVDSFREAAPQLRRPFTPEAVKFKVQATWPKGSPTGGLIVAYIDARLVVERLNLICPHLWHDEYQPIGSGLMWCSLTVDEITRRDVGEGQGKGLVSDALKRAAVKFGIGVSLYAIPKMRLDVQSGALKPNRESLEMTPRGESNVRSIYRLWLDQHGKQAFGDPLDHGDVPDAAGDPEDRDPAVPESAPPVELATDEDAVKLTEAAKGLTVAKVKLAFGSCAVPFPDPVVPERLFSGVPRAKVDVLAEALAGVAR